ncbi:MAG: glycosyltransferase family protein, partial [Deferribacterales bacterium]
PYGSDITVLQQVIRRLKRSKFIDTIVIATTTESEDERIIKIADYESVRWFRGSKEDVLSRYYFAAKEISSDIIVRITSDCPCIDPDVVDRGVKMHIDDGADYTSNCRVRSFPHGLDFEVISFEVLEKAYKEALSKYDREHVCPYIYGTKGFKLSDLLAEESEKGEDIRITLDTIEDYALLASVYDYLYEKDNFFDVKEIVNLFKNKPWLKLINLKVVQKRSYHSLEDELMEGLKLLKLQDMENAAEYLGKIIREIKGSK